eukprot:GHVR01159948.1.p1 GENE.GHVR01159948.1~~GHVR01159948.1.p1  ORF type:complete len:127 (-),score=18.01 GHVR01159948.1:33-413(-)
MATNAAVAANRKERREAQTAWVERKATLGDTLRNPDNYDDTDWAILYNQRRLCGGVSRVEENAEAHKEAVIHRYRLAEEERQGRATRAPPTHPRDQPRRSHHALRVTCGPSRCELILGLRRKCYIK